MVMALNNVWRTRRPAVERIDRQDIICMSSSVLNNSGVVPCLRCIDTNLRVFFYIEVIFF